MRRIWWAAVAASALLGSIGTEAHARDNRPYIDYTAVESTLDPHGWAGERHRLEYFVDHDPSRTVTCTVDWGDGSRSDAPGTAVHAGRSACRLGHRFIGPPLLSEDTEPPSGWDRARPGGDYLTILDAADSDGMGAPRRRMHVTLCHNAQPGPGQTIVGTASNDTLCGTKRSEVVHALGGDDHVLPGAGADRVRAGDGNDVLIGDKGDDRLRGGASDDELNGHTGDDLLRGGSGDDVMSGTFDDDVLIGGDGADRLGGKIEFGNDSLDGSGGDDRINGGAGNDVLAGGDGDDALSSCEGDSFMTDPTDADDVAGGSGIDRARVDPNDTVRDVESTDDCPPT